MASSAVEVSGSGQEPGGHGVGVDGRTDPVSDGARGEGSQLVGIATGPDQLQALRHADVLGVRLADPLTDGGGDIDAG